MITECKAFFDVSTGAITFGAKFRRVIRCQAQWFFTEDMLALCKSTHCPLEVQLVRQRNIDNVNIGIGEQGCVIAVGSRYSKLLAGRTSFCRISRREREQC